MAPRPQPAPLPRLAGPSRMAASGCECTARPSVPQPSGVGLGVGLRRPQVSHLADAAPRRLGLPLAGSAAATRWQLCGGAPRAFQRPRQQAFCRRTRMNRRAVSDTTGPRAGGIGASRAQARARQTRPRRLGLAPGRPCGSNRPHASDQHPGLGPAGPVRGLCHCGRSGVQRTDSGPGCEVGADRTPRRPAGWGCPGGGSKGRRPPPREASPSLWRF